MDNELTGLNYVDAHRLRVYTNDVMTGILDLITSPGGVATTVQGGSGIDVTEVAPVNILSTTLHKARRVPLEPTALYKQ